MLLERATEHDNTPRHLPAHLKGTREGLFYLLNASQVTPPTDHPETAPQGQLPAPQAAPTPLSQPTDPAQWRAIVQADNFLFVD